MELHARMAFLDLMAKQVDPGAPGFWRDFLLGMLKPLAATAVVAMAVALSFSQRLGLEGETLYAIARAFLQLSIGFVLQFIFTQNNAIWILLAHLFMVTVAGYTRVTERKAGTHEWPAAAGIRVATGYERASSMKA